MPRHEADPGDPLAAADGQQFVRLVEPFDEDVVRTSARIGQPLGVGAADARWALLAAAPWPPSMFS